MSAARSSAGVCCVLMVLLPSLLLAGGSQAAAARQGRHPAARRKKPAPAVASVKTVTGKPQVIYERVILRAPPAIGAPPPRLTTTPEGTRSGTTSLPPATSTMDHAPPTWAEQEALVFKEINEARRQNGLPPLKLNPALTQVARDYSRRMGVEQFFSHTSPSGEDVGVRAERAGVDWEEIAENLAQSVGTRKPWTRVAANWMTSDVHRANMLNPLYTEAGVGIWGIGERFFFTAVFVKP